MKTGLIDRCVIAVAEIIVAVESSIDVTTDKTPSRIHLIIRAFLLPSLFLCLQVTSTSFVTDVRNKRKNDNRAVDQ